jgi:hypothetical protein
MSCIYLSYSTKLQCSGVIYPQGGHSLMKFKIMCVQTLLPLCYMLRIIQNFIYFFRAIKALELYFVNF